MQKLVCSLFLIFFLAIGCEKFEDSNLDFSNNLPQYVELTSGAAIASAPGMDVSIGVRIRENINVDVTVNYDISGDFPSSGSVVIAEGDLSTAITLLIPAGAASGSATVTLTGVDNGLTLGRGGPAAGLSAISRMVTW